MADPYLSDDESVILATDRILFRSVTLPAVVLTNRRVLLLQTEGEDISAEEILLSQIRTAQVDLHPGADPVLTLTYRSAGGESVQEALTFPIKDNQPRTGECGEWAEKLNRLIAPPSAGGTTLRIPPAEKEPAAPAAGKPAPAPVSPPPASAAGRAEPRETKAVSPPAPSAGGILAKHDRPADLAFPPLPKIPDSALNDTPPPSPRRRVIAVAMLVLIVIAVLGGAFLLMPVFLPKPAAPAAPSPAATPAPLATPAPVPPAETVPSTPAPQALPRAANETQEGPAPVSPTISAATPSPELTGSRVPIPATGVWVRVQDTGNFTGTVGAGAAVTPVSGTGERFYQLVTKTGTVRAIIQKLDGSGDLLTVDIYRDGLLVGHGETRAPFGEVNLQFGIPAVTPAPAAGANSTGNG